eukprot:scaffold502_cov63-Phaeocystis_antarctica.AAC.4
MSFINSRGHARSLRAQMSQNCYHPTRIHAAFGSHLAAWVVLVRSYCTICVTRSRMARSISLGLARRASRDPFGS